MSLPLENIKVLEIAQTLAGPFSGQMLSDLGAEVIKIEKFTGDETRHFVPPEWQGESTFYMANNRNKRSITLNLKSKEGLEIVKKLAKEADVLIENFRTGTADRLGFGYEAMKEINPGIIYLSISGFGGTGPLKDKAGYDLMIQAYSGLMSITGEVGRAPVKTGISVVDLVSGTLGATSVLSAIIQREKTGKGQHLDLSLLDSTVLLLNYLVPAYLATGKSHGPMGSGHPSLFPYQAFKAKDQYVVIACANDGLWQRFCETFGWDDLQEIEKFRRNKDRVVHREELESIINERLSKMEASYIIDALEKNGIPNSPINTIEQVVNDEQIKARDIIKDIPHPFIEGLKSPVFPVKFSDVDIEVRSHPPMLGEHTIEVLQELGYEKNDIEKLSNDGVVGDLPETD